MVTVLVKVKLQVKDTKDKTLVQVVEFVSDSKVVKLLYSVVYQNVDLQTLTVKSTLSLI